jgi:hypothetical protein
MGTTTFTGPIKAGDVLNTTGTTVGTLANVGYCEMAQLAAVTQAGTATVYATNIVIPANSHIVSIQILATAAWDGVSGAISIGTSTSANELVSGATINLGLNSLSPGADATRTAKWTDVGASDVRIYVDSANTGGGIGEICVRYIQAANVVS